MANFINFSRAKRGSTQTGSSSSPSAGRRSIQSQHDAARIRYFRMRSIRSTMSPEKLLQCFRDEFRNRISLRPLVPSPLFEPETVPELSVVASLTLIDSEKVEASALSPVVLIDDDFCGFTNLYEPAEPAAIDVIAIPALNQNAFGSWAVEQDDEMWLQDFLPDSAPRARVLIYGHAMRIVESDADLIASLAASFCADLRAMRQKSRINQRPLVLIAHSTGCLILKKALCTMPDLVEQDLVKCVVFLGAPHDGLDRAAMQVLMGRALNGSIPRDLSIGSQAVLDLNSAFAPIADQLHIVAFFETGNITMTADAQLDAAPPTAPSPAILVPQESATLFRSVEQAVDCDHFQLTQATAGTGVIYHEIVNELQAIIADVIKPAGWRIQQRGPASPTSQGSESDYFPESPTMTMKSWQSRYEPSVNTRTKSIPTPFRRRSSTLSIPPQLALHYAVRANDVDEARRILETFTELDAKDPSRDNRTALHEAAERGNVEVAKALLDAGAAVGPRTRSSFRTPLHFAAREGHNDIVKLLLDRTAKINSRSADQSTPLILAVEKGHTHIAKVLLGRNANVHFERDKGVTALELSQRYGHDEISRMLKVRGARINYDKPSGAPEYPGLF